MLQRDEGLVVNPGATRPKEAKRNSSTSQGERSEALARPISITLYGPRWEWEHSKSEQADWTISKDRGPDWSSHSHQSRLTSQKRGFTPISFDQLPCIWEQLPCIWVPHNVPQERPCSERSDSACTVGRKAPADHRQD